jgi:uncharacterized membrane protein
MANEHESEPLNSPRQEASPEWRALETRIQRLEEELAALRSQIAPDAKTRPASAASPTPESRLPPPPPRIPSGEAAPSRLMSEAWTALPPRSTPTVAEPRQSFENQLGSQVFNRIAIVLLLIGTAFALKLVVDRGWIGPLGRVLAGLAGGTGLVLWSERFRTRGFAAFSYSLKAVGTGVLYLTLWAAFQRFHLIPATPALLLMVLVTAWNAYMAWVQNSELLATYALAGGFSTPMLLSTGGDHEIFLFTYLLALDLAIVALVRLRSWPRLLLGAFPLTVAFFIGWYARFYAADELTTTSIFIVLFGLTFASVSLTSQIAPETAPVSPRMGLLQQIFLPLANAAFIALAFYSVLQDANHHSWLPWLMLILSAAYLGWMRLPQRATAAAIHLSLAVVFLTIAIPLKASGHWITVSWLVEGLALLWVATRLEPTPIAPTDSHASVTLRWLSMASLFLGFAGICVHLSDLMARSIVPMLNQATDTALTGIAIFAAATWLSLRARSTSSASAPNQAAAPWDAPAILSFSLIAITALLLPARELVQGWTTEAPHPPFQTSDFFTALLGLAVFAAVIAIALRLSRQQPADDYWRTCAALSTIAFNLIAVLTGVREITAVWNSNLAANAAADTGLRQALAISAFLMLYGAALLAVGFWKRSSFLRWQALALLVFTILKTFLYDMRNLSQGYRVASLLGLGALLMAISFAYQKDWLSLREPDTSTPAEPALPEHPETRKAQ